MFQFRLQKVMQLRQLARDQRRVELAQAHEADRILQQQRDELSEQLAQLKTDMRRAADVGEIPVDQLLSVHRYQLLLRSQLQALIQQSGRVAQEIERRRQLLLEAEKEYRVIDKLRENLHRRHDRETAKRESQQLDEMAQMALLRKEDD